jgi:ABC-2 type transport system ATP-binding protein
VSAPLTAPAGAPAAEPDAAAPVIQTRALSKRYPGPVTALDALTVTVEPGITGLVGANGAGKSTLIKILLGLLEPTGGEARVFGRDCQRDGEQIRGLTGYMPEHDCLPPDVTATEFVTHLGRMSGLPPTAAKERAAESLRHVGLYEERYRQIGTYSTGMKQRVKLAQALVGDPRLLLLDEPTVGLDPAGRNSMLELIARIGAEFGISIVVASHLLGEIERICDHLVAIEAGRLLRADTITSMTQVSQVLLIDVDEGSEELLAELGRRGLEPRRHERSLLVDLSGDATYDIVRDAIADLALPLNRLEQRRRRVEELFQDDDEADALAGAGAGAGAAARPGAAGGGGPGGTPEAPHAR